MVDGGFGNVSLMLDQDILDERFVKPSFVRLKANYWLTGQTMNMNIEGHAPGKRPGNGSCSTCRHL